MSADDSSTGAGTGEIDTPRENKDTLDTERDVHVRAEVFNVDEPLTVSGSAWHRDGEITPVVSLGTAETGGVVDNCLGITLSPGEARQLADRLTEHAEYAERYADHRRRQDDTDE
jgi:hypothetical protein